VQEARKLPTGSEHYRAFVGPTDQFDFMSSTQFAFLYAMGIREHHKVLDFGCGSLRLGRLLIPFLNEGKYFGIEPNEWLIEDGIERELGRDTVGLKKPRFNNNADFDTDVFGEKFDYIVAQSILTHTGPSSVKAFVKSASRALAPGGLLLFSYICEKDPDAALPEDGWYYPACVNYTEDWMLRELGDAGLLGMSIPWYHPAASWIAASPTQEGLPQADHMDLVKGAVLRAPQFAGSIR